MRRYFFFGLFALLATISLACAGPTPAPTPTTGPEPGVAPTATTTSRPTPEPPSASFSVDVESGSAPLTVEFNNSSQGRITSMEWDFGDGMTSDDQSPNHSYTIAGTYDVELTVMGPGGTDTSVMSHLITVDPGPPTRIEISTPTAILAVQEGTRFTAVARDEFGNVVPNTLEWAMAGEGGSITENGLFTADTEAGTFTDTVKASLQTDAGELVATASVTVQPGPLSAVAVEPVEILLELGATQPFTFTAFDEFGNRITDALTSWRASPEVGVIDANGVLTAGTKAGRFLGAVRLEAVEGAARVSVSVDVVVLPGLLATIAVQPSYADVERGADQQFTAHGLDKFGNEILQLAILWESTGGTITQSGFFSGGSQSGTYGVTASATLRGNSRSGSATIGIPPTWIPTGNLDAPRRDHAAFLLQDGTVLIVGGTMPTAELYDPAAGTFALIGEAPFGEGAGATRLADGSVLVVGGEMAMIYDPTTRLFTRTGALNAARTYSSVTLLPDGKVLVAGGQKRVEGGPQTLAVAEVYDPATGIFTLTGTLIEDRSLHSAVLLPNGIVLIVGGLQTTTPGVGKRLDIAELYDPVVGEFSVVGETRLAVPGGASGVVLLNDGKVLLAGGIFGPSSIAEIFDPASSTFSRTGDMTTARRGHTATLLSNGQVLIAGGSTDIGPVVTNSAELYDPASGAFSPITTMNDPRLKHTATLLPNGRVLIIGGFGGERDQTAEGSIYGVNLSSAEIWIPSKP